jgi:non-heme chloroperoxidase
MRCDVFLASRAAAFLSAALVAGCGDNDSSTADAAAPDALLALDAGAVDAGPPDAGPLVDYPKQTVALSTGIDMQYVEVGNPAGAETVIMLHGYTDSSRSYFPTIDALAELNPDLHIYALDLRGHGGSSMPDAAACASNPKTCFGLGAYADDVFAFMDTKGITTAHLVGHSMGAMLAHEIALAIPGSIESLVLIGVAASTVANPLLADFILGGTIEGDVEGRWQFALESNPSFGEWPQDAYNLTPLDADPDAEEWMAINWVVDPVANQDFVASIVPETARVRIGTWLGSAEALLETDNTARLANLAVDSLILWATQDLIFFESDQVALRTALDAAATACRSGYFWKKYGKAPPPATGITDLSHNTHRAAPAQVAADINAFITTGEPTPDLYFASPDNPGEILTEIGTAEIIEKAAATGCAP